MPRHHKGPRTVFTVRLPQALSEAVRADAERLDESYSEFIANILAERYGHPSASKSRNNLDQMKLTA